MAKGADFERRFCKELSLWWSDRKQDDLFWRSSMSGGRSTVRHKTGKATAGHSGDICATAEISMPLTNLITFELKSGYNKTANAHSLLDFKAVKKSGRTGQKMYEAWIEQAILAQERAGTPYWMLIHRRDGGIPFCFMPSELYIDLCMYCPGELFHPLPDPFFTLKKTIRFSDKSERKLSIIGMKWCHFLFHVDPRDIRILKEKR